MVDRPKTAEPTTESRIRVNLNAYRDAASDYSHLSWKAAIAKGKMDSAVDNLKALGALDEVEKLRG